LELALTCDLRVGGERTRVGQPEILLGVLPGAGGTQRLARLIGPARAKELIWSGRQVRAEEAHALGILDRVVGVDEVETNALHWAAELGTGAVVAMGLAKRVIDDGLGVPLAVGSTARLRRSSRSSPPTMRASEWSRSSSTVPEKRNSPAADRPAMSDRYELVSRQLQHIYDGVVDRRAASPLEPWKLLERAAFLEILVREDRHSLLEIGAGTGVHGRFFADAGFDVVCTDLSPAMVEHCRAQGSRPCSRISCISISAVSSTRSSRELSPARAAGRSPGGARAHSLDARCRWRVLLGQYGGIDRDGPFADDPYESKRYFSLLPDDTLLAIVREHFTIESFRAVDINSDDGEHFQSLVLRA